MGEAGKAKGPVDLLPSRTPTDAPLPPGTNPPREPEHLIQ